MGTFTNPDNNIARLELTGAEHVVVFGSGAGGHSFAAMRAMQGKGRVTAIDVRSEMIDKLKADATKLRYSGFQAKTANYEMLGGTGLMSNAVDAVIVPNTLFSAGSKKLMLSEAFRILKVGGKLLIIDWNESYGGMGPQPEHVVTQEQARELVDAVGYTFLSEFSAGAQHYGLLYKKAQDRPRKI